MGRPNDPRVEAEAKGQRLSPNIAHPEPHVQRAGVERIGRARFVTERPGTIRCQREFDQLSAEAFSTVHALEKPLP